MPPSLEDRLRGVSRDLVSSLECVIREAVGRCVAASGDGGGAPEELRPVLMTTHLGLDKSLASRVVRSIAAECELRALLGIPTPQGLALIAGAARDAGVPADLLAGLEGATQRYSEILGEFSGGRTDLDAALSGWIPEQRLRAERDARRSVFRGMTTLCGTRASAVYNAVFLTPSSHADRIDTVILALRQDLRRLRSGARLHVVSLRADPSRKDSRQRHLGLDGVPLTGDPARLVLAELCSHPIPALEVEQTGEALSIAVHRDALDVNEFATIGLAWRNEAHFPRYATDERRFLSLTAGVSCPTEALVVDVFVHRALGLESPPEVTAVRGAERAWRSGVQEPPAPDAPGSQEPPPLLSLDDHPSGLASSDVRSAGAVVENLCREAGLDLQDFAKTRLRVAFPLPVEEFDLWWSLPTRDAAGD